MEYENVATKRIFGQLNSGDKRCPQDGLKIPSAVMISSDLDFRKVGSTATICTESMRFQVLLFCFKDLKRQLCIANPNAHAEI